MSLQFSPPYASKAHETEPLGEVSEPENQNAVSVPPIAVNGPRRRPGSRLQAETPQGTRARSKRSGLIRLIDPFHDFGQARPLLECDGQGQCTFNEFPRIADD